MVIFDGLSSKQNTAINREGKAPHQLIPLKFYKKSQPRKQDDFLGILLILSNPMNFGL
jgi:hypothetical protein